MHRPSFGEVFYFAYLVNNISPAVSKEAMKVMQNPCLNDLGQQSQGTESMAQVIL